MNSYRDGSQDSFIDDGSQCTVGSGESRGGTTGGRGSQRRARRRPAAEGDGTPHEREQGPDMYALYRTSLLSPDEPGFFNDRAVYRGGQNKLVFGKETPSPTSSDNNVGEEEFQYDNPYSPRPLKRSRTTRNRHQRQHTARQRTAHRSHGAHADHNCKQLSTGKATDKRAISSTAHRVPADTHDRRAATAATAVSHTATGTADGNNSHFDLCVTDILDDDDDIDEVDDDDFETLERLDVAGMTSLHPHGTTGTFDKAVDASDSASRTRGSDVRCHDAKTGNATGTSTTGTHAKSGECY